MCVCGVVWFGARTQIRLTIVNEAFQSDFKLLFACLFVCLLYVFTLKNQRVGEKNLRKQHFQMKRVCLSSRASEQASKRTKCIRLNRCGFCSIIQPYLYANQIRHLFGLLDSMNTNIESKTQTHIHCF